MRLIDFSVSGNMLISSTRFLMKVYVYINKDGYPRMVKPKNELTMY
jgi:hypothetical protein